MEVPIVQEGERRGALEIRAEGAYTRFEARCAPLPGLRRLYVCGGGARACLGVLAPEEGELRLRRRLSRAAMKGFPERIEYAVTAEGEPPEVRDCGRPAEEKPQSGTEKHREEAEGTRRDRWEEAEGTRHPAAGVEWEMREDRSLVGEEGGRRLLALPCALRRVPPGLCLREIGGRSYLVFRT